VRKKKQLTTISKEKTMASLIPESALRLQGVVFVSDAELSAVGRVSIIRLAAENLAEKGLRKLMNDCIKTEGDYMGYRGQTLKLDVYVLSPEELHKIIADALRTGGDDATRWMASGEC